MQSAITITLSQVITTVISLPNFCNSKHVWSISIKVLKVKKNETWYSERGLWGKVQNARTITLSSLFMELFLFLIFAILNLSKAYLWKYKKRIKWNLIHWETAIRDKLVCSISLKVFYCFINITLHYCASTGNIHMFHWFSCCHDLEICMCFWYMYIAEIIFCHFSWVLN